VFFLKFNLSTQFWVVKFEVSTAEFQNIQIYWVVTSFLVINTVVTAWLCGWRHYVSLKHW